MWAGGREQCSRLDTGAKMGTSRGIGSPLRALGVGHYERTCMALVSVSGWNREHVDARLGGREAEA